MIRFYLLPESNSLWRTQWYDLVLQCLGNHPCRTENPEDADLLIPGMDTAMETNWPNYGQSQSAFLYGNFALYREHCVRKLNELPLSRFRGRLVLFDMNPFSGFPNMVRSIDRVWLVANSLHQSQYRPGLDVSFPTCSVIQFNRTQVESNQDTCLASFVGFDSHPVRRELARLHNGQDVIVHNSAQRPHIGRVTVKSTLDQEEVRTFASLLQRSRFAFVPRGDALFSYRLFETMAAGAVPVIFSDGWVLPFSELLDWSEFSLHLPENQAGRCLEVLRSIPDETVLKMRRKALWVYQQFFSSVEIQISCLLRLLSDRLRKS
jgi:hypothetical protein